MARPSRTAQRRSGGFTLLEVMIAIGMLVTISMTISLTVNNVSRLQKRSAVSEEVYRSMRVVLSRLVNELSQAYLSMNDLSATTNPRTYFVVRDHSTEDEVFFTTMLHQRYYSNARESDQSAIRYFIGPDPLDRDKKALFRFESTKLDNKPVTDLPGSTEVALHDIVAFNLTVRDAREPEKLRDEWDTLGAPAQANRLPQMVRIELTVKDEHGEDLKVTTDTFVYLEEALNLKAN